MPAVETPLPDAAAAPDAAAPDAAANGDPAASAPAPASEDGASEDGAALRALTGEEQRLYDRQIRLWGVEAQRRLSTASILIVGDVRTPVVQELAKNVVLTGIAKLRLHTPSSVDMTKTVPPSGLLGRDGPAVVAALQAMNCLVDVALVATDPRIADATVVCAAGLPRAAEVALGAACRAASVPYLCGRVAGAVGWFFVDDGGRGTSYGDAVGAGRGGETKRSEFGWHVAQTILAFEAAYHRAPGGSKEDVATVLELYAKLRTERGAAFAKVETVVAAARAAGTCLPPVAAIVAGMWGRETIKLVSADKKPIDNFFFFNAATSAGSVEKIGPK